MLASLVCMAWSVRSTPAADVSTGYDTNYCLKIGERFGYRLYWGIIPVGRFEMSSEWITGDDGKFVRLVATAWTFSLVSNLYPVDDHMESIVDPKTFLPVRYSQDLREGRKLRKDRTVFRHSERVADWRSEKTGRKHAIPIEPDTRDVLTLLYHMCSVGMAVGEVSDFKVLVDEKLYDLKVSGLLTESLKNEFTGTAECLKIEPKAWFGEIFVRKGRMHLWFLADKRHWFVLARAYLPVADFRAVLTDVTSPGS